MMKKFVITGPSCSGKSSLIRELKKRGFYVVNEVAASYILKQKASGAEKPWLSPSFQPALLRIHLDRERRINPGTGIAFFDRGVPDTLAFFKHRKQEVPEELAKRVAALKRYDKVFALSQLPFFESENFRIEKDAEEAKNLFEMIRKEYELNGYSLINVPSVSVEERVNFILENLG
jgi:predicted ATPase